MWSNTSFEYLRRLRSNIKLRRRRSRDSSEKFYEENNAFYKVIICDFNAKIGPRRTPEELHIGIHGVQWKWNEQGEKLSEFITTTKTSLELAFCESLSRWTWKSSSGEYRNEIDHIIVSRRFYQTHFVVVRKFYTESDHRLLQGRFSLIRKEEKAAKLRKRSSRTKTLVSLNS
ncbi:hypothetical protein RB195_023927 [Necator americanus]|uniref:Endonuclease/exonuclease/phosphatase domain-containing protein n=1 Tax=Necator americanus TaxID=51031 RepID=A0ABR1ELZ2_NECAM